MTNKNLEKRLNMLVVEDGLSNEIFDEIKSGEHNGTKYNIHLAKNVKEGLDLIEKRDFDSYICDMGLPYSDSKESEGARYDGFDEKLHEAKMKYFQEEFGFDRKEFPIKERTSDTYYEIEDKYFDNEHGLVQSMMLIGKEGHEDGFEEEKFDQMSNGILITNRLKEKGKIPGEDYIAFTNRNHCGRGIGAAHMGKIVSEDDLEKIKSDLNYAEKDDLVGIGNIIIGDKENTSVWKKAIEFAIDRYQARE